MSTISVSDLVEQLNEGTEAIWNRGELERIDEQYAEDVLVHDVAAGEDVEGREAFKAWVTEIRGAFPDFHVEIADFVVGEGKVVSQWRVTGTHEGPLPVLPDLELEPTGESIAFAGATVFVLDDELVTEAWWYYDLLGIMAQLGALPEGFGA